MSCAKCLKVLLLKGFVDILVALKWHCPPAKQNMTLQSQQPSKCSCPEIQLLEISLWEIVLHKDIHFYASHNKKQTKMKNYHQETRYNLSE